MKLLNFIKTTAKKLDGLEIISTSSTSITPKNNEMYTHILANNDNISINTTNLSNDHCIDFELWLVMPSSLVSFTFDGSSNIIWNVDNNFSSENLMPSFNKTNTLYCICIRFDGTNLLANLAYTKELS